MTAFYVGPQRAFDTLNRLPGWTSPSTWMKAVSDDLSHDVEIESFCKSVGLLVETGFVQKRTTYLSAPGDKSILRVEYRTTPNDEKGGVLTPVDEATRELADSAKV